MSFTWEVLIRKPACFPALGLLLLGTFGAAGQVSLIPDSPGYNAGSTVRVRPADPHAGQLRVSVRYSGEERPLAERTLDISLGEYQDLWAVPREARTGRYEIVAGGKAAGSFAVFRKLVAVERVEFDRTYFTSGDPVDCRVTVRNLSGTKMSGLRVEVAPFYFPWIAPAPDERPVHPVVISSALALEAGAAQTLGPARAGVAAQVDRPALDSYAVVIWDQARTQIYDLHFTRPVFLRPPGVDRPKAYPFLYLFPELKYVNNTPYRHFYAPGQQSAALRFDTSRTMFTPGSKGEIGFTVNSQPASIRARLLEPGGEVNFETTLPGGSGPKRVRVPFAAGSAGLERFEVELRDGAGQVSARGALEVAVNELPKSILIFAAHEDDDMIHPATIRAAVENNIPIHLVYFTGGDAGGCERFYNNSCGPVEAMEYGKVRMEETRAALAHLGVPAENIFFLGLPDGGLGEVWRHKDEPYLSVMLASDHSPYDGMALPNLPYTRTATIEAIKHFIRKFRPAAIYTGHPDERHIDHRVNNWLVVKAMQEMSRAGELPGGVLLRVDQVYGQGPQKHAPYKYEKHVLHVSGEAAALAQEAWWNYQTQDGNHFQGALKTMDQLSREEVHWLIEDWSRYEGWNEKE